MIDLTIHEKQLKRTVQRARERSIIIPRFAQMKEDVDPFSYWLATRVLQGQYTIIPPEPENPYAPHLAFL